MRLIKTILQYVSENGEIPVRLWMESLHPTAMFRVEARLDRLSSGNLGDWKSVGEGVFELRLQFGPGYRVYFAYHREDTLIVLLGGDKGSQEKDVKVARGYWADFKRRNNV
ncbi:MAG: type II toxin-antitoxin system RelE/ParE family toxin [Bdellovibrionales bacterium]|nr:type II toxin-antitoxin system RelE/ParE family toxin [Bdellovibrionales bacterium]